MFGNNKVFAVEKGAKLIFKLKDESLITLTTLEYVISSTGGGSYNLIGSANQGATLNYLVLGDELEKLMTVPIEKYRIYTTDGYVDAVLKDKKTTIIQKHLNLIR